MLDGCKDSPGSRLGVKLSRSGIYVLTLVYLTAKRSPFEDGA